MGSGSSSVEAYQQQVAEGDIAQNYSGTCDFKCSNLIKDVVIDIEDSTIGGGIIFKQQCKMDEKCTFNVGQTAAVDITLVSSQTQKAGNAGGWLTGLVNVDKAKGDSYQSEKVVISQDIKETCKMQSLNEI